MHLKVAEKVDMAIIDHEMQGEMQATDTTLDRCRNRKKPFEIKGRQMEFLTKAAVLYRQCITRGEKPVLQIVGPACLRGKVMNLAHDSIF